MYATCITVTEVEILTFSHVCFVTKMYVTDELNKIDLSQQNSSSQSSLATIMHP